MSQVLVLIINKLFSEKVESLENDPIKALRGGDRSKLTNELAKKLLKDKVLKIAIIPIFAIAGIQYF